MKINYETALIGNKVILAPYRLEHVPRYHAWMKDPDLLEATGSEPLSMEEEITMQRSWRDDPNKCTFIVHASRQSIEPDNERIPMGQFVVKENLDTMVGDVNLFLSEIEHDEDDEQQQHNEKAIVEGPLLQAEIDIMIAEKDYQGKGIGKEATSAMILYGATKLGIKRFFCKINEDNMASQCLFKSLGFGQCNYAECFKQVELELMVPLATLRARLEPLGAYREVPCPIDDESLMVMGDTLSTG